MNSYIARNVDQELDAFINNTEPYKPVLLIEGARQVGKTRILEHALDGADAPKILVNLERDTRLRQQIDACAEFSEFTELLVDKFGFKPDAGWVVAIDEAQESLELGRFVRFMKEEWQQASAILTGSSLTRLFRSDVRYPVGRVRKLLVQPFSFSEYLLAAGKTDLAQVVQQGSLPISEQRHQRLLEHYDDYIRIGGLPEVVLTELRGDDGNAVRAQIIADYEQDFIRLFGEQDLHIVKACLRSVANFVGGVSKNTTVIPEPGSTVNARINEVFARLESWHMILRSDQHGPSPESNHRYHPKRYLFDTGVLRHLRESAVPSIGILSSLDSGSRTPLGGVLENQLAIAISADGRSLSGWKKSSDGMEIDFVCKYRKTTIPIECKAALKSSRRQEAGIVRYLSATGSKCGIVVSFAPFSAAKLTQGDTILHLPAYLLDSLDQIIAEHVDD